MRIVKYYVFSLILSVPGDRRRLNGKCRSPLGTDVAFNVLTRRCVQEHTAEAISSFARLQTHANVDILIRKPPGGEVIRVSRRPRGIFALAYCARSSDMMK